MLKQKNVIQEIKILCDVKGTSMPSERTRIYLDELEDRFQKRAEFYASLEKQLKKEKNNYKDEKNELRKEKTKTSNDRH